MALGRLPIPRKVVGNGVFDGKAGAHFSYIIVEFSSRPGGIGGDRGVPRESMRQLAGITDMQRGANIHCFCRLPLNLKHLFQMSFSSKTLWYLVKFKVIIYLCITRVTRVSRATIMTGKSSRDNVRMFQEGICQLFPSLRQHFYQ